MEAITGAGSRCEEGPEQHTPSRGLCRGLCPRCRTGEMPQPPACILCWHSARAEQGRRLWQQGAKGSCLGSANATPFIGITEGGWGSLLPLDGWWRGLSDAQHPWEPVPMVPLEVARRSGAGLARCPIPMCSAWLVALSPRCLQPAPGGHGQPKAPGSTASVLRVHPAPKRCWGQRPRLCSVGPLVPTVVSRSVRGERVHGAGSDGAHGRIWVPAGKEGRGSVALPCLSPSLCTRAGTHLAEPSSGWQQPRSCGVWSRPCCASSLGAWGWRGGG